MGSDNHLLLRDETIGCVANLFENYLCRSPPSNPQDLWKEHVYIRQSLDHITQLQSQLPSIGSTITPYNRTECLDSFLSWADQIGIHRYGVSISPCDTVGGFGLKAEKNVEAGDLLVSVPRHAMISTDLVKKSAMLKKICEHDKIVQAMDNVALALFLCGQRLRSDSKWNNYLNILPESYGIPLFYSQEQLQLIRPSPVFEESLLFYRTVARQFAYFFMMVAKNDLFDMSRKSHKKTTNEPPLLYNTPFTVDNFTFSLYQWSVGCVATRINLIPSEIDTIRGSPKLIPALIPVLDMANHELMSNVDDNVSYNVENDSAHIQASVSSSVGQFISIFYGRRSNGDHLLHNGFVPQGDNPSDIYKLKIGVPRGDKYLNEKMAAIEKLGFSVGSTTAIYVFDLSLNTPPFHNSLRSFLSIYVSNPPTEEIVNSEESKKRGTEFLKARLSLLIKSYGTITEGKTINEVHIERLKRGDINILQHALEYCNTLEE